MTKFRGHDIDHRHYKTPRQIDHFYPESGPSGDAIVGRWALGIVCVLIALYWIFGGNV